MFVFRTLLVGTIVLFGALIVGPWLALQFDASFPPLPFPPWVHGIGVALIVLGGTIAIFCTAAIFAPGSSRPAPYDAGGAFTIAGPYRYVRNPFMLGVILALWGEAILLGRIVMMLYAVLLTWAIHLWVIFYEEPSLRKGLGRQYQDYLAAVPRWVPQLRKYE
jgi:protein-S-isoprenylcysteine O-methyltransferase Ste14